MKIFQAFLFFLLSSSFVLSAQVIEHQTNQEGIEFEMQVLQIEIHNAETGTYTPTEYVSTQIFSSGRPIIDRNPILNLNLPEGATGITIGAFEEVYGEEFNTVEISVHADQGDYIVKFKLNPNIAEFEWNGTYPK